MSLKEETMIQLKPLQQQDFEKFLEREIRGYAEEHVRNGNWPAEGSLERSRKEFERLLPDGIHSEHQYLWSLVEESDNQIGVLWVRVKDGKAFIFNFVIEDAYRGKGYGKQSLIALDEQLRAMDVESIGLHVFGDNLTAQELYKKMGYVITGIHMQKKLKP
jgi:ribosomal protein S18 acetylase RimI-like enzyme